MTRAPMSHGPCPDCGTMPDTTHDAGCHVEPCSVCGLQKIACDHAGHEPRKAMWTGEWPGLAECRERGWYAMFGPGGWQSCEIDAPGATEDLNRLHRFIAEGGE